MAALCERLLERDLGALDVSAICARWPTPQELERIVRETDADPTLEENAVTESRPKHPSPVQLRRRLELLQHRWPAPRHRLREQPLPAAELRLLLDAASAPSTPGGLGLTLAQTRASAPRPARSNGATPSLISLQKRTCLRHVLTSYLVTAGSGRGLGGRLLGAETEVERTAPAD